MKTAPQTKAVVPRINAKAIVAKRTLSIQDKRVLSALVVHGD